MICNSALNLYAALGVDVGYVKETRNRSHTKTGPGRRHHNKPFAKKI